MRAVVHDRYGPPDVLRLEEVGEVAAVGPAVTEFEVGDHVFGVAGFGAHAEFVCLRESPPLAHKVRRDGAEDRERRPHRLANEGGRMSRLINTTTMTVDGVTDVGEWYVSEGEHDRAARDQFDGAAGMVFGRKTYEGLAAYWPEQTGEWGDLLNPMPKFVASRTLEEPLEWNATLIEGDAADGVARLKDELDGDLILIGCGELASYLLANGLVDELRFWLHPAVWGEGARPYQGETARMRLLDATSYDSGVTLLRYAPLR